MEKEKEKEKGKGKRKREKGKGKREKGKGKREKRKRGKGTLKGKEVEGRKNHLKLFGFYPPLGFPEQGSLISLHNFSHFL
jgi:hypothetical protein